MNKDFTIISRDCIGGVLYHQLGLRFLSPTINLFFVPDDFNIFCLHLKKYIKGKLVELEDKNVNYPVGLLYPSHSLFLKPIRVDFMHYDSFTEAYNKWEERKTRINYKNIYIINSFCYPREIESFSKELVKKWNKIKYKKMVFVDKKYGFKDEYLIAKPDYSTDYAWLLTTKKDDESKRVFNEFDFIKFLNE